MPRLVTSVDLIIPTYNGADLLLDCLRSLRVSTFTDYNLIVFDDGSTEPVAIRVLEIFSNATVLRSATNGGLTRAFNTAIDASNAEYVVLLNDDTEVEPDWVEMLVRCADRHPRAGSIASKLRLASDRKKLHSAGDTYSVRGMPGNRGVWLDDFGQYDAEEEVFSACAGAALYRRSALDAVRLANGDVFDTRLFMYCEDVDLGWRLQLAGYRCVFAPDAVVYHRLSATGGGSLASYFVSRNIWLVLARSVPADIRRTFWKRIAAFHVGRTLRAVRSVRQPASRRQISGTFAGLWLFLTSSRRSNRLDDATMRRIKAMIENS